MKEQILLVDLRGRDVENGDLVALYLGGNFPSFIITSFRKFGEENPSSPSRDPKFECDDGDYLEVHFPSCFDSSKNNYFPKASSFGDTVSRELSTLWNEVYVGREEVVRGLESYAWSKPYAGLFAEGYDPHSDIKKD